MGSNFESRILICTECNEEFVFTVEAQEYFIEKGYVDDPQMCKHCYTQNKRDKRSASETSPMRNSKRRPVASGNTQPPQ